jgi:hypothetical protein
MRFDEARTRFDAGAGMGELHSSVEENDGRFI